MRLRNPCRRFLTKCDGLNVFRGAQRICNDASAGCVDGLKGRMARSAVLSGVEESAELEREVLVGKRMVGRRGVRDVNVL
jgi:hypothetical protein